MSGMRSDAALESPTLIRCKSNVTSFSGTSLLVGISAEVQSSTLEKSVLLSHFQTGRSFLCADKKLSVHLARFLLVFALMSKTDGVTTTVIKETRS